MSKPAPTQTGMPKYRLTEAAAMHDRVYEADSIVEFDGIPGPHMEPLNEAAHGMVKKHNPSGTTDPVSGITI